MAGSLLGLLLGGNAVSAFPPPRGSPGMGWNAWNTFSVDGKPLRKKLHAVQYLRLQNVGAYYSTLQGGGRKEYESIANAMIESGMVAAGYTLVSTVCTGWIGRDPVTHELQQNLTNWPGGMKSFADFLHSKGMQLSVYTDAGRENCCQEPGSLGYEALDMKTFASWGADCVAVDYCGGPAEVEPEYIKFADGISAAGRSMELAVFNLGSGNAQSWAPELSRNLTTADPRHGSFISSFRSTRDIGNYWDGTIPPTESLMHTVDQIQQIPDLWTHGEGNSTGTYPNYGQLVVGVPPNHPTSGDPGLTLVEAQSHFSMWCIFPLDWPGIHLICLIRKLSVHATRTQALLLATNDVRLRDRDIERILFNNETIAINQDPWGIPATRIANPKCSGEQWFRPLANGDVAVLVLNRESTAINARVDFVDFLTGDAATAVYEARDVQQRRNIGKVCRHVSFNLQSHETAFLRLSRTARQCTTSPTPPCTVPPPKPAPFPIGCPPGFTEHASGYWKNYIRENQGDGGVVQCSKVCGDTVGCSAFEVFNPGEQCHIFVGVLEPPFTAEPATVMRTCIKQHSKS